MTFLDELSQILALSSAYNANDVSAPAAVLWTDKERQWETLIPLLRAVHLPLLTYGVYDPVTHTGPAYWLRCMIARSLPDDKLPPDVTPIIYLPGVSRQEIRAVEDCPRELQPLAELQYRGLLWSQRNAKDWTIAAFLQAELNIPVAGDAATREALQRALVKLAETPLELLRQNVPLRASWLDGLLHPDEVRSLLLWLNNPSAHCASLQPSEWQAFTSLCRQKYHFDPERDGELNAAELLGEGGGPWDVAWERYKESPLAYPRLAGLLAQVAPPVDMFDISERWPNHNENAEENLRDGLAALENSPSLPEVRAQLAGFEARHAARRGWVWAKLGRAPLALALESLARLAHFSERPLPYASLPEMAAAYREWAWQVDAAALESLRIAQNSPQTADLTAVKAAVRAIYKPWLEKNASQFQQSVQASGYPYQPLPPLRPGTCLLFSDALRMDCAHSLAARLVEAGLQVHLDGIWAALPPVTSTSKPAFSPDQNLLSGQPSRSLNPTLAGRESPLTADSFRNILREQGFQILIGDDLGENPSGLGWTELGQIDTYGHQHGVKLALHLENEIQNLASRIRSLLAHGWARVQVVSDHGWLLLPGSLPKAHLPESTAEQRKGRCARLKPGSQANLFSLPWHWDSSVAIAYAPGIQCFEAGKEYEHGGLSLQECFTPLLTVQAGIESVQVGISEIKWRGLRCQVTLSAPLPGLQVDLRTRPADASTSLLAAPKALDETGQASLVVANDDLLGVAAVLVVLNSDGALCAQSPTLVGC